MTITHIIHKNTAVASKVYIPESLGMYYCSMLRGRIKGTDSAIYSILHASGAIYAILHCFRCNISINHYMP